MNCKSLTVGYKTRTYTANIRHNNSYFHFILIQREGDIFVTHVNDVLLSSFCRLHETMSLRNDRLNFQNSSASSLFSPRPWWQELTCTHWSKDQGPRRLQICRFGTHVESYRMLQMSSPARIKDCIVMFSCARSVCSVSKLMYGELRHSMPLTTMRKLGIHIYWFRVDSWDSWQEISATTLKRCVGKWVNQISQKPNECNCWRVLKSFNHCLAIITNHHTSALHWTKELETNYLEILTN